MTATELQLEAGQRLRMLRNIYGYNIRKFAEILGIGETRLSQYELGARRIPLEVLAEVVNQTGINLNWLLLGDEKLLPHELFRLLIEKYSEQQDVIAKGSRRVPKDLLSKQTQFDKKDIELLSEDIAKFVKERLSS